MNITRNNLFIFSILLAYLSILSGTIRNSSYPYISGDTFRAFADVVIDETTNNININAIKKGDIIFLKTDYLDYFFNEIHPRIKESYILLTHNSDYAVPGRFSSYLDDPKLYAWYGQNIDRKHSKLFPIPIGLANSHWPHGNTRAITDIQKTLSADLKNIVLYINYSANTSVERANKSLENLVTFPFAYASPRKSFEEYLQDMAHSIFVVSPPGNGQDCHRTWEALYLGAIPIVKDSTISELYRDLPILVIKDWAEIDEHYLKQTLATFSKCTFNLKKIYADYWFEVLNTEKKKCIKHS